MVCPARHRANRFAVSLRRDICPGTPGIPQERSVQKDTYFITRTRESQDALTALGLTGHIGTDTAWSYDGAVSSEAAGALLRRSGWDGTCPGTVTVRRCYFSRFYAPNMCRVMSAMDRGIFAGLFGGGELTFKSRITEGLPCCRAEFSMSKARSKK